MGRYLTSILVLMLLASPAATEDKSAEAIALVDSAERISLLRVDGRPKFRLQAKVTYLKARKVAKEGEYTLLWASPVLWREEIRFPDYAEVRVADGKTVWTNRTEPLTPGRAWQTSTLLDYGAALRLVSNLEIAGLANRSENGTKLRCIRLKHDREKGEVCFLRNGQQLVSADGPQDGRSEFGDFAQVGEYWYPRTMRFLVGRRPVIEAAIEDISLVEEFHDGTFELPPDSRETQWCPAPTRPKVLVKEEPRVPVVATMTLKEGAVEFLVRVGPNGYTRIMETIASTGPEYTASAVDAVRGYQYEPARCDLVPVESQVVVEVPIRLH